MSDRIATRAEATKVIFRQTVKIAVDQLGGTKITAADLLKMEPETFHNLRRQLQQNTSEAEPQKPRLTCAICSVGLHLKLHGSGNRYFVHDSEPPACPWYTGGVVTRELRRAEEFLSEKESAEHYLLKWQIADALKRDPEIAGSVVVQETLWGELLSDQWRRPDVQCIWQGRRIAFEVQLGTTHLREVVFRENFYRSENIFVIWVFHPIAMGKAAHADERYFNRRNVFFATEGEDIELDESESPNCLKLLCRYDSALVTENGRIVTQTAEEIVGLEDLTYPEEHYRPFYFDYPASLLEAEQISDRVKESIRAAAEREAAVQRITDERRQSAKASEARKWQPGVPSI